MNKKLNIWSRKMKKILYFILLIAELFVGTLLMLSLWESSLYILVAITVAAMIALLIWQIVLYTKTNDTEKKRKIAVRIALTMLIPCAVFAITFVVVAIMFIFAFAN
jgi:hypothetical protein